MTTAEFAERAKEVAEAVVSTTAEIHAAFILVADVLAALGSSLQSFLDELEEGGEEE